MSNPSIVFQHSLKCSKVKRTAIPVSVPAISSHLTLSPTISASSIFLSAPLSSRIPSTLSRAYSASASTPLVRPSSFDPAASDKIHPIIPLLISDVQSTPLPDGGFPSASVTSDPTNSGAEPATTSITRSTPSPSNKASLASPQASATPTSDTRSLSANPTSTETGLPDDSSQKTKSQSENDLPRVLVGSIFGVIGFVAFVALVCIFLLRRRRRKYGDDRSMNSNGKLSRVDRNSAPTLTSWKPRQSRFSFHAGTPSPASQTSPVNRLPEPLAPPKPILFHNPFSKSAELCSESQIDTRGARTMQNPFADPEPVNGQNIRPTRPSKSSLPELQTIQEEMPEGFVVQRSAYGSDHSLGSTIVLPGRNSSVGSLQVISYRISSLSSTSPRPVDPAAVEKRMSIRSDPFDLEAPSAAVHRRGS